MFLCLFERTNMICHGPTILHFPETIAFCIPHDFAQSSISDIFNIDIMFIPDPVAGVVFSLYKIFPFSSPLICRGLSESNGLSQ